jgi:hypothetical protein
MLPPFPPRIRPEGIKKPPSAPAGGGFKIQYRIRSTRGAVPWGQTYYYEYEYYEVEELSREKGACGAGISHINVKIP